MRCLFGNGPSYRLGSIQACWSAFVRAAPVLKNRLLTQPQPTLQVQEARMTSVRHFSGSDGRPYLPLPGIIPAGAPRQDGPMETRTAKLETATDYVQRSVAAVRDSVSKVETSLSDVRERIVKIETRIEHMPTKLEMWAGVGAIIVAVGGALWWIVQQYLGPILAKAAGF